MPASAWAPGLLGLSPQGSRNCFSFWLSPDVPVENQKLYRSRWLVGSTVPSPDDAVQFRLRVNQRGAWAGWDRVVNSYLANAPAVDNSKLYDLYFKPRVTGTEDNRVIFSFDIASFAWEDDANAWSLLEELVMEEIGLTPGTEVQRYDFTTGSDGWVFQNTIPPFDPAVSGMAPGLIGLSPAGSVNCFSYWWSPEVAVSANKIYRVWWQVGSTASNADDAVQFRLRINQKGAWSAWNRIVNSYLLNAPSASETKTYEQLVDPRVSNADDNKLLFSFDIMSFDFNDDESSWLFLDAISVEEIILE
ncbi:MAG: hypothetical protein N2246_02135 [Candidatus Sumerlaeia bacterium]|nr:hypothetical protein [Candidatus Sumerlaeia bacterium]